jgi:crotonobetainyl-CoA:carnitine CoA-transferase CaiB-like acyl-CoA transferase
MTDPVAAAQNAHRAALAAQTAMREASRERDTAVQAARAAGVPAAELAAALGVNRHRIHAMLKTIDGEK